MKRLTLLLVLLLPPSAFADSHANACLDAAHQYFINVDSRQGAAVAELFTNDAVLSLPRETLNGPVEIEARFSNKYGPTLVHHLTTHAIDPKTATGKVYVLLHIERMVDDGEIQTTLLSGVYHDEYVIEGDSCRFASRRLETRIVTR